MPSPPGPGDPWPWMLCSALFLGSGVGFLSRALWKKPGHGGARAGARSTVGMALLALAVLAATGLLVFPAKAALADRLLPISGIVAGCLGLGVGLLPRAFGLPLAVVSGTFAGFVALGVDGWLPAEEPVRIAMLTPFIVSKSGWQGELDVEKRDTLPIVQRLDLPGQNAGIVVERLELDGPLAFVGGVERYRIAGIATRGKEGSVSIAESFAPRSRLLDFILPLGDGLGASREIPFARRWREWTDPLPLAAFDTLSFRLDPLASKGSQLEGGVH